MKEVASASIHITGQIISQEDFTVVGQVDGSIQVPEHCLTVAPEAKVFASVSAREVIVMGSIQGNIEASAKATIRKTATVIGDIRTPRIVIEDGAFCKGIIDTSTGRKAE
ncbi:MAG: polymer-forming cytoskeletal protein [Bryobacteraceae bacterium]